VATLRITSGPASGQVITVRDETVIGREAEVRIEDPELSRRHAVVRRKGGLLEIEDLGSSNGTFVDGERISGAVIVGGGSRLRIGTTEMAVEGVLPASQTRARRVVESGAGAVAEPQVTRARPVVDPQVTRARPIAEPQPTQERAIAEPQATKARAIPEPQATKARAIPEPQATQARATPPPGASPAAGTPPLSAPASGGGGAALPAPVGTFSPPARRRSRGLASRSWVPVVLSYGTVIAVAVALVVYFATR
jgi:ABC transport system ATP-binding/permease protein